MTASRHQPRLADVTNSSYSWLQHTNQKAFASNNHIIAALSDIKQVNNSPVVLIPLCRLSLHSATLRTFREDEPLRHGKKEGKDRPAVAMAQGKKRVQRAVADHASDDLRTLLQGIFDAEEQITEEASPFLPSTLLCISHGSTRRVLSPCTGN